MLKENINKLIDVTYKDIEDNQSDELQTLLQKLKSLLNEDDYQCSVREVIFSSVAFCMSQYVMNDDFFHEIIKQDFEAILAKIPHMKKSMILKVELVGLESQVNRWIEVPYTMSLLDMCLIVLASVYAQGHQIQYVQVNEKYYDVNENSSLYAGDIDVDELALSINDRITFLYDMNEQYCFQIEICEIRENEWIQSFDDMKIISGHGYGIWEDYHDLLEMYYDDRSSFLSTMKDLGFDENDFIFDEFDVQQCQKFLNDYIYELKILNA